MHRILKDILLPLLLTAMMLSCVQEEQYENTAEGNFEALWSMIDEHYCFLDYKKEAIGLDWDEVHGRYKARINKNMNNTQLFEVLAEMLAELRDGHVNLYSTHDIGRNWSWYEDYPVNFYEDLQDKYLGTDYKIASSLKYKILEDNIGYIVCQSFSSGFGEGNLDEIFHAMRTCNGIILDLRNNSGGNLDYAERLAQRFTNERILVGYMCHKTGKGHSDFSDPEEQWIEPSAGIRWQKEAVVLTNRKCYSATNTIIRDLHCCPRVTIIGDQTGGGSGLPFSSELPNGWSVRFSAAPMYDKDMKQIEFGIEPDIYVSLKEEDRAKGFDTIIETARQQLQ